jgi:hypothetical protein
MGTSPPGAGATNAVYLVLKYGVVYDPDLKASVVVDSAQTSSLKGRPEP